VGLWELKIFVALKVFYTYLKFHLQNHILRIKILYSKKYV